MVILDTSFLVALFRERDENFVRAKEILEENSDMLLITEFVFAEFVNYLSAKDGGEKAHSAAQGLLEGDAQFIFANLEDVKNSLKIVKKYTGFSFTDASCVAIMKEERISKIASFDSDFDKIKGIERIF